MRNILFKDKNFYKTFMKLTIPIALQNLIASSLNMVDTIMIGQVGETEIAAVGFANQFFFVLCLFLFGVCSGSAVFTAQFWGKKDVKNIRRVLGICLILGITASLVFTLVGFLAPEWIISIFSKDPVVITLGSNYLRISCFSYVFTAITFAYSFILRSTEQANTPMKISAIALGINTVCNYILILGHFGFPKLGVEGAAIATLFSRVIETALTLIAVYSRKYAPAASIKEMFDINVDFIKRFFKTTIPVILNESLWGLGTTLYSVVYGRMGTDVAASTNIAGTVEKLAMVFFIGMAHASAVMIGNRIGANEEDKAFDYAKRFIIIGPILGLITGIILIMSSHKILSIYNVTYTVYHQAEQILFITGAVLFAKVFNTINIVGVLRSGGDTKFCLAMDTIGVWFIAVPLAFIGGLVLKLPVAQVYFLISLEEVFKFLLGFKRFTSKKWINNLVTHITC